MQNLLWFVLTVATISSVTSKKLLSAVRASHQATSARQLGCPDGSKLIEKICVEPNFSAPSCPSGSSLVQGQCASFAKANRVCAEGWTLSGDKCIGNCYQGMKLGRQTYMEKVPQVCPNGYQLRDNECTHSTSGKRIRSQGSFLNGENYTGEVKIPASLECPNGFSLTKAGNCAKPIRRLPQCKLGFSFINDECIKVVPPHPQSLKCPPNSSKKTCLQEALECPAGTFRGSSGRCEGKVAKRLVCNPDEDLVGDSCRRESLSPPVLRCLSGYTLVNNKCEKHESIAPTPQCSLGTPIQDKCVTGSVAAPHARCPDGFIFIGNSKCFRLLTYYCRKTSRAIECKPTPITSIFKHAIQSNLYKYIVKVDPSKKIGAARKEPQAKTLKCSRLKSSARQLCFEGTTAPLEYHCADGDIPLDNTCLSTYGSAKLQCSRGSLDKATGQCKTVQPVIKDCRGGRLNRDGFCRRNETNPTIFSCPEGWKPSGEQDDLCIPERSGVDRSVIITQRARIESCVGTKNDKSCANVEKTPQQKICPAEAEYRNGRCVQTSPVIAEKVVYRPATYVCREGNGPWNGACYVRNVVGPKPICPDGFSFVDGTCCEITKADLQCPDGFVRYERDLKECIKPHPMLCPNQTKLLQGLCYTVVGSL